MTRLVLALVVCGSLGCAEGGTDPGGVDARAEGSLDTGHDTGDDDTGSLDTGSLDTGALDTGIVDTGSKDDGAVDGGGDDTGPLPCPAIDKEPNDTEATGVKLTDINDCDGSGSNFAGVIAGGADTDVFRYRGTDTFGCVVDPYASTSEPVRLCLFVRCTSFLTMINSCPKGLPQTWGTSGISGCCAESGGEVQVDYTCTDTGTSDTADVFMRIDKPSATTCENYSVKYHF